MRYVRRLGLVLGAIFLSLPCAGPAGQLHRMTAVPALAVMMHDGHEVGLLHYILIQLDEDRLAQGPTVLFSEALRGSAVGDEWKDGVRAALQAATALVGADPKTWTVTIRNQSRSALTDGASASGAVAIGLVAAWREDRLHEDVVLTGRITADGRIGEVGALPLKLDAARQGHMRTVLVPRGQTRTREWDLQEQASERTLSVIEVSTLEEAYELMSIRR